MVSVISQLIPHDIISITIALDYVKTGWEVLTNYKDKRLLRKLGSNYDQERKERKCQPWFKDNTPQWVLCEGAWGTQNTHGRRMGTQPHVSQLEKLNTKGGSDFWGGDRKQQCKGMGRGKRKNESSETLAHLARGGGRNHQQGDIILKYPPVRHLEHCIFISTNNEISMF